MAVRFLKHQWLVYLMLLPLSTFALPGNLSLLNLTSFSKPILAAVDSTATQEEKKHPEFGELPTVNLPCTTCYEDLSARTLQSRTFVLEKNNSRTLFSQYAASPINYRDENGFYRSIDSRLKPSSTCHNLFEASQQPVPVKIDPANHHTSLHINGKEYCFNKNIRLIHRSATGKEISLGTADWSNITAGDDGVMIRNIYPDIDLVFITRTGEVESGFLINKKLPFTDGEIVLIAGLEIPGEMEWSGGHRATTNELRHEPLFIFNEDHVAVALVRSCFAFDDDQSLLPLSSGVANNELYVSCPVNWLNEPSRIYPVLLDPVVTTQGVLPNGPGGVTGTKFSPVCWTNGCDYTLSVPTPANATLVRVLNSFEYYAVTGACQAQDGGYSVQLAGCTAPSAFPGVFTCPSTSTNYYCTATNVDITGDVAGCLPPDQCASQQLDFTLHFFRCNNDPDVTCSDNCIRATQPWIITLESRDLEIPFITPDQQVCSGTTAALQVFPQYGITPYAFSWSTGAVTDTITVSPTASTSYTVTVTDACATTSTATTTMTVIQQSNPGFTSSVTNVCVNETLTVAANGAVAAAACTWIVPGSNAATGVISGSSSATLSYTLPGIYSITLRYQSGGCSSDSTIQIVVDPPAPVQALLQVSPSGTACPGDTITYSVSLTNAGAFPVVSFLVNGVTVQSGNALSYSSTQLQQGDLVQAVVVTAGTCIFPAVDTASLFAIINGAVTPAVSISTDIDPCVGNTVTFSALAANGGTAPDFQWLVNGIAVPGATSIDFTRTLTANDTTVGVVMNSSLTCVTTPVATSSFAIGTAQAASVSIASSAGDTICAGGIADVIANTVNGGSSPTFEWYLNGILTGDTTAAITATNLQPGDQLQVFMTSSSSCAGSSPVGSNLLTFSVYPPLTVLVFGASPVCEGLPVTISAQAFGGDGGPYTYAWNGVPSSQPSFSFLPDGSQYVRLEVVDDCGSAPIRDSTFVIVKPKPFAGFNFSPVNPSSLNPLVEFTDRSQGAGIVRWYFGDGDSSTVRYPVHSYDQAGTYLVTQLVTAPNGCTDTLSYTLVVSEDIALYFPSAFTPNSDDKNDTWQPYGMPGVKYTFVIIDRWGGKVFEGDQDTFWPGTFMSTSSVVPEGVYTFVVKVDDKRFSDESFTGKITLVR